MKKLLFLASAFVIQTFTFEAHSEVIKSTQSNFILTTNRSNNDAVLKTPEGKSIAISLSSSPLILVSPDFPYSTGIEIFPEKNYIAWIIVSKKPTRSESDFIDCVVITNDKKPSFAPATVIQRLKDNERKGKEALHALEKGITNLLKSE